MTRTVVNKFNRGEVDRRAQERLEIDKISSACSLMKNFIPKRLGSMLYRPGTKYLGSLPYADQVMIPFVFSMTDTAMLILGLDGDLTVYKNNARIEHPATSISLINGSFSTNLADWTQVETNGANCVWVADNGGSASLYSVGDGVAAIWQTFTGSGYVGTHSITVEIEGADVFIEIGATAEAHSNDFFSGRLGAGVHNIRFVATSQPTITFSSYSRTPARVVDVTVNNGGYLDISLGNGLADLESVQVEQSGDVVFCGAADCQPFKIERRENDSWSIVKYQPADGPFGLVNDSPTNMKLNVLTGSNAGGYHTLTSNKNHFTANSVGNLYKLVGDGQASAFYSATDDEIFTEPIRISGASAFRDIAVDVTITAGTATVTLQKSTDLYGWSKATDYTVTGTATVTDSANGDVVYYRIGIKNGDIAGSTVTASITNGYGSQDCIVRVVSVTNKKNALVEVLQLSADVKKTYNWYACQWNEGRYPNAPRIHEGRLFWAGKNGIWGSISDQYESFDSDEEGSAAPIRRTIGFGPVDFIQWLIVCSRLIIGIASDEISLRSNSYGDPLTQSNANLKSGSTQGTASVRPVKIDDSIVFAQRSGKKLIQSEYSGDGDQQKHSDLMMLHENICSDGIKRIVVTRQPETRIYVLLDTGELRLMTIDSAEDVYAWSRITMDGEIQDIAILPDTGEDAIYIIIERNSTLMLEVFDPLADMIGNHFDSSLAYTSPTATITGLSHLEGNTVGVWADSQDRGTYTVSGGSITVSAAYTNVVVGLPYVADYKTGKIVGEDESQGERKRIIDYNLSVLNLWPRSIKVGYSFDVLDNMPLIEDGTALSLTAMINEYDGTPIPFNGSSEIDPRLCIRATGPCEILALTYNVSQYSKKVKKVEK